VGKQLSPDLFSFLFDVFLFGLSDVYLHVSQFIHSFIPVLCLLMIATFSSASIFFPRFN